MILLLHVFAIYGFKKIITWPTGLLFLVVALFAFSVNTANIALIQIDPPELGLCIDTDLTINNYASISILVLDVIIIGLIAYKTVKYNMNSINTHWSGANLLNLVSQRALTCYVSILVSQVLLLVLSVADANPDANIIGECIMISIFPMAINHLVLSLSKANKRQVNGGTSASAVETYVQYGYPSGFTEAGYQENAINNTVQVYTTDHDLSLEY